MKKCQLLIIYTNRFQKSEKLLLYILITLYHCNQYMIIIMIYDLFDITSFKFFYEGCTFLYID